MRTLLALILIGAMAGGAIAQATHSTLGVFLYEVEEDGSGDPIPHPVPAEMTSTNVNAERFTEFNMYLVLFDPIYEGTSFEIIQAVEASFQGIGGGAGGYNTLDVEWTAGISGPAVIGWGDDFNFQVVWPIPTTGGLPVGHATILGKYTFMRTAAGTPPSLEIKFGPSTIPSIPGTPLIVSNIGGVNTMIPCRLTVADIDANGFGVVGTVNGGGVVATEDHSLSSVKALFR